VADQDDLAQILHLEDRNHVADVRVQVDVGPRKVLALAQAGQGRGKHIMSFQERTQESPAPAAVPGAVHQHERGHGGF